MEESEIETSNEREYHGCQGVQCHPGTDGLIGTQGTQGAQGSGARCYSNNRLIYAESADPNMRPILNASNMQWTATPYLRLYSDSIAPKENTNECPILHYRGPQLTIEKDKVYKFHTGLTILLNPNQSLSEFVKSFTVTADKEMSNKNIMIHNVLECETNGEIYCSGHLTSDTSVVIESGTPIAQIKCVHGGFSMVVPDWSTINL